MAVLGHHTSVGFVHEKYMKVLHKFFERKPQKEPGYEVAEDLRRSSHDKKVSFQSKLRLCFNCQSHLKLRHRSNFKVSGRPVLLRTKHAWCGKSTIIKHNYVSANIATMKSVLKYRTGPRIEDTRQFFWKLRPCPDEGHSLCVNAFICIHNIICTFFGKPPFAEKFIKHTHL